MQLQYELPKMLVESVSEDRWLAGDRAIYMNFRLKPADDPTATGTSLRIIYDFQARATLHQFPAAALARSGLSERRSCQELGDWHGVSERRFRAS